MDNTPVNSTNKTGIYDHIIAFTGSVFNKIRKHILLFLFCIAIPAVVFLFLDHKASKLYESKFTVVYEELARKIYGDRIAKVDKLLKLDRIDKVSYLLSVEPRYIRSLKDLKGENILGQNLEEDMNTDRIPFVIKITVDDTNAIQPLQKGIMSFLEEGNKYMVSKKALKIKEINQELVFVEKELAMMDSLKQLYNHHSFTSDDKPGASIGSVYQLSFDLYKRKQELLRKKEMPDNLQVIDDAIVPVQKGRGMLADILLSILAGTILFLILVYFIIPVIKYRENA